MKLGYDVFGKEYGFMLRNDLHSPKSIDHVFLKTMILLDDDSYHDLYKVVYCQTDMTDHELFPFSQQFKRKTDRNTIDAVLEYTSSIAKSYDVPFEEMLFGGTEKQIIERGTDWCADMARVCCVILKCLNIPCRILHVVDINKAYNGHVVCEAFYENEYGVIDPIYGFRFYNDTPINGYYLLKNHNEFSLGYDGYMNLYSAIAINEYDPLGNNDYSMARPNEYCSRIINTEHNNKWFMGEDGETCSLSMEDRMYSDIKIHKATLSAALQDELIAMSALWESENSCFGYRANTAEDFEKQDIIIADIDGLTVGYLLCHTYTQEKEICTVPYGSMCLEIEELYILPEHRSRGIGKALYETAVENYGDAVDYVTLTTATKNYKSILHFYIDELDMTFWSARLFEKVR